MEDLFEIAKKMELEGQQLYESQAKKTTAKGIKNILLMLADQEKGSFTKYLTRYKKTNP